MSPFVWNPLAHGFLPPGRAPRPPGADVPGVGLAAERGAEAHPALHEAGLLCICSALFPSPVFQAVSLSPHVSPKETRVRSAGVANAFQAPEGSLARPAPHPTPGPSRQVAPPDGRGPKLSGKEEALGWGWRFPVTSSIQKFWVEEFHLSHQRSLQQKFRK